MGDYVANEFYNAHLRGVRKFARNNAKDHKDTINRMYRRILTELCVNRFNWQGLPEEINTRFLELTMFSQGAVVFWHEDELYNKYFVMKAAGLGSLDVYDDPTSFTVTATSYGSRTLSADECVPIYGNYLRVPDLDIVLYYASRFADLDQTIDINSKNARRPRVITVPASQRLTASNINKMIEDGSQTLPIDDVFDINAFQSLDLGGDPRAIEYLHVLKVRLWNECCTLLGIDNANQDKKERLVASEVNANDGQIQASRFVNLNERKNAAEKINAMFNLNVSVDYHGGSAVMRDLGEEPSGGESGASDSEGESEE